MSSDAEPLTELLEKWRLGDREMEQRLFNQVYPIMCAQAQAQLGRLAAGGVTLCATELVNEAYERLRRQQSVDWRNRNHFLAIAARVIRRVLVDHLRQRGAEKRGGPESPLSLNELGACQIPGTDDMVDLLILDDILDHLGESDPEALRVVELRMFSGLNVAQIADVCGVSTATVGRRWRFARAWLSCQIGEHR